MLHRILHEGERVAGIGRLALVERRERVQPSTTQRHQPCHREQLVASCGRRGAVAQSAVEHCHRRDNDIHIAAARTTQP